MAMTARDFVPNGTRKIRAGRPDGIGMPSKGNRNAMWLGRDFADETPRFGAVVPFSNVVKPYVPTPVPGPKIWDGRGSTLSPANGGEVSKPKTRRTPPPAGRRPSLKAMRAKG